MNVGTSILLLRMNAGQKINLQLWDRRQNKSLFPRRLLYCKEVLVDPYLSIHETTHNVADFGIDSQSTNAL